MYRTSTIEGFILLTDRFGEIHKRLTLFTEERGLLSVIAHGALKPTGKLKSLTELFLHGRFSLYHDPVKESYKITDAECLNAFFNLRSSLAQYYAANLCAEIILKSFGGGEAHKALYGLLKKALYLLAECGADDVPYLALQFIMRFLDLAGFEAEGEECLGCRKKIGAGESGYFLRRGGGFVCAACRPSASGLEFSPGARDYRRRSLSLGLEEAMHLKLPAAALLGLKQVMFFLVQESLERELNTLEAGKGWL